ncbi:zinc-finger double domain-containing protein [Hirsutella rhossiliensis]|uniref:Zinc-finger double domain-containing protein n=1 Tax=Hirsutella rhossiliensis TaxID=111463 RepID=A0A9P8MZH1_9HYPO|nr:zinc-finger double domain-containing protein [Hirsutella rhossiliensis]KAH0964135.1 zinc-finger double domain-containing protein [Hirsutella rhossiliensis]
MEATSFSSRRAAAGSLPAFSLPPPTSDVPRASDGLSPSLSSVHTASSQGSQAHSTNIQYTYSGPAQQPLGPSPYGARSSAMYGQQPPMGYANQRSSQSPATGGDVLPAPSYESVHQPFSTSMAGGGGGGGGGGPESHHHHHHHMSPVQATPHAGAMLAPHNSTQPPTPSAPAPVDPYAHSRPPSNPSYYAASTTPQHSTFPSMGPPHGSYRTFGAYSHMPPTVNGPVMSNMHHPGTQMSVISGMGMSTYAPHPMMYGHHNQPQPHSERPFKCDQCTQSFSRNHDLKRHKRIHLAVKPFPCNFCSKSFSRKDALKRHRLVKGCENKSNEHGGSSCRNGNGGRGCASGSGSGGG